MFDQLLRVLIQQRMNTKVLSPRPVAADAVVPEKKQSSVIGEGNVSERVKTLVSAMTRREKLEYIGGTQGFCMRAVPRLGIPAIWTSDATSGVRGVEAPVTTFPAAVAMAASWNRDLVGEVASAIGSECRAVGVSILLAPGVNITRVPTCGRNFEYMGEDPFLAGEMAASYVAGVQKRGVLATVKHFACNNSDYDRHKTDSVVDERTLRELYLPSFHRVLSCGGLGVMTSYNPVNGSYASENAHLIGDILRGEWGFRGLVISDWNSLYSTAGPVRHGVDMEMPIAKWMSPPLLEQLLSSGEITMEQIDQKIIHILDSCERLGILDRSMTDPSAPIGTADHKELALSMARESVVLLKNDGDMLPLSVDRLKRVVILGRNARQSPSGGGGSSYILANLPGQSLPDALRKRLSPDAVVSTLSGKWWRSVQNRILVKAADAVVFCTGYDHIYESEAYDRMWELPPGEATGIRTVCALNANTVVVLHGGGAMAMASWIDFPRAVLDAFYLGQASAEAVADILLGTANPSGKLPFTIARNFADYASTKNYPKKPAAVSLARIHGGQGDPSRRRVTKMRYEEGLMVGYRQFDTQGPQPLYPFGHGLSYTSFRYEGMQAQWKNSEEGPVLLVSCEVSNAGARDGAEVVQLYVHPEHPSVFRPDQELKGFAKVFLPPNEQQTVCFALAEEDFAHYDVEAMRWIADAGIYVIRIGSSSRDIRLSHEVAFSN